MSSCQTPGGKRRVFKDAGRACPVDYRIPLDAFSSEAERSARVLYVVGGLYGNPFALDAVRNLVDSEDVAAGDVLAVFNGDMHWFDKTAENFAAFESAVSSAGSNYVALVGNVEAELRRQVDVGVGCGCAYPDCTSDESVCSERQSARPASCRVGRLFVF